MTVLSRRRWLAAGILGTGTLLGLAWLSHLDFSRKISTDVLDLLPAAERAPELAMVRELAGEAEARVMLFVLTDAAGAPAPALAARRFAAELSREKAFAQVLAVDDPAPREALGHELFARRFTLLFPQWLRERETAYDAQGGDPARFSGWLATDTVSALSRFLGTPEAMAFQDLVPSDPLLLLPGLAGRMKGALALAAPSAGKATRVWAAISASPLSEEGQTPVFAAIGRALDSVRPEYPGLSVAYTGVNRFAAASRVRIEREVSWLNGLSLAALLAVALAMIRRPYRALHLAPPVLIAVLGAWVCATAAFPRVHIVVCVVGAMLTGVAVDYGFYLYMQAPTHPGEDYWEKVRRLRKPLFSSCLTTVVGFTLLVFSELPLIRQLGAFVAAGLVCALGAAIVYFSSVGPEPLQARFAPAAPSAPTRRRLFIRRALVALWIASLPGLFLLKWRDDVRELQISSPAISRDDDRIRALFGQDDARTVYLSRGANLAEARQSLERLGSWLKANGGSKVEAISLGAVVPTPAEFARAGRFLRDEHAFCAELGAALEAGGFDRAAFAPFFEAYAEAARRAGGADLGREMDALVAGLRGPLSLMVHAGRPLSWFVTLAQGAPTAAPPPETRTLTTDELQSLNQLFTRYRRSALVLSLTGLALVGAGVLVTYGVGDGVRIFAIPCGACLGLFGLFGWFGLPLNLFHLLGAFLGVCLTHNYSIFSANSAYRRESPPPSVRLSAVAAAATFGVLALSGIPVVRALGETVALMVLAALAMIEFEHFSPLGRRQ